MAIMTRGFGVDLMPRFTPVDPELVALNPNRLVQGISSTFQLADAAQRIAAYKALQEELTATREGRIAGQNIGNQLAVAQGGMQLRQLPRQESIQNLVFNNQETMLPEQGKLGLAQIGSQLARLPSETSSAISTNLANKGLADIQIATEDDRKKLAIDDAARSVARSVKTQQAKDYELENKLFELKDKWSNAETDAERARIMEQAKITLTNAQADQATANANYLDAGGRASKAPDPIASLQKLSAIENAHVDKLNKAWSAQVPGPKGIKVTLSDYYAMTRQTNDKGQEVNKQTGLIWKDDVPRNKEAEAALENAREIAKRVKSARDMTTTFALNLDDVVPNPITPAPNQMPRISSRAEYDALPPDTEFIGGDGKKYTKPK